MDADRKKKFRAAITKALSTGTRTARRRRSLTQAEVAELIDVASEVYARIERGEGLPSVITLVALCNVLHESTDRLLGISGAGSALPVMPPVNGRERPPIEIQRLMRTVADFDPRFHRELNRFLRFLQRWRHEQSQATPTGSARARRRSSARTR